MPLRLLTNHIALPVYMARNTTLQICQFGFVGRIYMTKSRIPLEKFVKEYSVRNKLNDDIPVYSVTNSQGFCTEYFSKEVASQDKTTYKIVPRGYFAYNPSRINVGSVDWQKYEDRVIVSPLYNVFSVSDEIDCQYLYYFFRSNIGRQMIKAKSSGSVRDNLKIEMLKEMTIPDISMREQQFCSSVLDKLQILIKLKCDEIKQMDELVKARFVEMFGTEQEMNKWNCCTVGDVADVSVGVVIKPTQYYSDVGIPAFRSLNVGEMHVNDNDWVYFTREGHEKNKKSIIKNNDVLVVRSGAPGTACVATQKYEGYNAVDIMIARPYQEKINSTFLAAFTNMPHGMNQIKNKTGGAAQKHFNVREYKTLTIILPSLEVQQQFADFVRQADKSKSVIEKSLKELETLQASLMQKYFS